MMNMLDGFKPEHTIQVAQKSRVKSKIVMGQRWWFVEGYTTQVGYRKTVTELQRSWRYFYG